MNFILVLLVGGAWAFYVALLIDRPDMAATIPEPFPNAFHIAFAVFMVVMVYRLSHGEIITSKQWAKHGLGIYMRNFVVVMLGIGLLLFTCREVLHGVDPSGMRKLW